MEINAKTLVLIDNSLSVSKVNREIAKLTLQYLFDHSPENRSYCFMPFSHEFEYAESYTVDYIGLSDMVSRLNYENKEISISDVLTETIVNWKEADYACRDILIVTDGNEEAALLHDNEELYYVLQQSDYPVYVIMLDQEDNVTAVKNLNAICTLSGGELFHTEFEGSDAEVERQVSEALFRSMDKYARNNWGFYDDSEGETDNVDNLDSDENINEDTIDDYDSENHENNNEITEVIKEENPMDTAFLANSSLGDVYEMDKPYKFGNPISYAIMGASIFMAICGVFLSWCLIQRRKKRIASEDESYRQIIRKHMDERDYSDPLQNDINASKCENKRMGDTIAIVHRNNELQDNDGSTRLLYADSDVADMTFEDANNPSKYYKITAHQRVTLGRTSFCCDIAFDYDDSVSARHCEIVARDGIWYVKDLDSSNGTFVNGEKVYTELEIHSGDLLKMGTLSLIVRF